MERYGRRGRGSKIERAGGGNEREVERCLRNGEAWEERKGKQN
jgi:hypothetical protein